MVTAKERKNIKALFRLMQENPELPVIPFVDAEVVAGDDFGCWMGGWGEVRIDEYLIPPRNEPIIFRDSDTDIFDTLEKMLGFEEYESLLNDRSDCQTAYDALPWKKAIILEICLPD